MTDYFMPDHMPLTLSRRCLINLLQTADVVDHDLSQVFGPPLDRDAALMAAMRILNIKMHEILLTEVLK